MRERQRWPIILCVAATLLVAYVFWSSDNRGMLRREIQRQARIRAATEWNMSEGSRAYMSSTAPPVNEALVSAPLLATLPPPPNTTAKRLLPKSPPPAQCLCPSPEKLKDFGPRKRFEQVGNATSSPGCILLLHRIAVSRVNTYHYRLWVESLDEHSQVSEIATSCPVVLLTEWVFCSKQFRRVKFDVQRRVGGRPKVGEPQLGLSDKAILVLHRVWEQGPYHAIVDPGLIPMYVMAETVAENVAFWQATNQSSAFGPIPVNYTGEYFLHRVAQPGKWRMVVAESPKARSGRKPRWALNDISATLMNPLTVLSRKYAGWFQMKKTIPKKNETTYMLRLPKKDPPELAVRGSEEGWFALGQVNWLSFWGYKDTVSASTEEERLPAHPLTAYEVRRFRRHSMRVCHHAYPPRNQTGLSDTVVVDLRKLAFVNDRLRGIPTDFINQVIRPTFGSLNIQTYPVSLWQLRALETVRLLRENKFYFGSEGAFFAWMLLASDESTWFMLHPTTRSQREWRHVSYHMTFARYLNGPSLVAFDVPYVPNDAPSPSPASVPQALQSNASTAEAILAADEDPPNPSPSAKREADAFAAIRFPPPSYVQKIIHSFLSLSRPSSSPPLASTRPPSLPMLAPITAAVAGLPSPLPSCHGWFSVVRADLTANKRKKRQVRRDAKQKMDSSESSKISTVWETVWLAPLFCVWEKS